MSEGRPIVQGRHRPVTRYDGEWSIFELNSTRRMDGPGFSRARAQFALGVNAPAIILSSANLLASHFFRGKVLPD